MKICNFCGRCFLSWLIPFIVSLFFYNRSGELVIDVFLFKSIMIVTGALISLVLIPLLFQKIENHYLRESVIIGFIWLAI